MRNAVMMHVLGERIVGFAHSQHWIVHVVPEAGDACRDQRLVEPAPALRVRSSVKSGNTVAPGQTLPS